jgi:hypothetical protein
MSNMALEWVRVLPEVVVVATNERAWLHRVKTFDPSDPFAQPMRCGGSLATTRNLLDGVICAAQKSIAQTAHPPSLTLARWVWRLAGYYHTTHATPPLMTEAAERFAAAGRTRLAQYATHKAQNEKRHDELALRDLKALGYDAELLVEQLVPPTAARLVDYFIRCVHAPNSVGCLGYGYALERLAAAVSKDYIERVKTMLPPGVRATRCLRAHSALGSDARHLEEAIEIAASLPADDRERIALTCYRTTEICCSPPPDGYLSEESIEQILSTLTLIQGEELDYGRLSSDLDDIRNSSRLARDCRPCLE